MELELTMRGECLLAQCEGVVWGGGGTREWIKREVGWWAGGVAAGGAV